MLVTASDTPSSMLPFFSDLVLRTDQARRDFENHPVLLEAIAHGMPIERYRRLLLELYHVVWHFNPACAASASRIDDAHRGVRQFLYDHMHAESGHEDWVLDDLEAVGIDRQASRAHAPSLDTLALTAYNYWASDRRHPCSVLGMMYTLEVLASVYGGTFAAAIRESLYLQGDRGISFISSHATMDADHMADLRQVLNTLEDRPARDAVVESALYNFHHVTRVFAAA